MSELHPEVGATKFGSMQNFNLEGLVRETNAFSTA